MGVSILAFALIPAESDNQLTLQANQLWREATMIDGGTVYH